jgi:pimeloyl-ACP methyl ester carboxylesterase
VVLLHGWPERAGSWDAVAGRLHEHGLRTLAPDQRGYSPGARPRFRTSYRLPALVADTEALVDRIGQQVHLVGHDWGATVAWGLAARRPDLVRTLTAVSVPHPAAFLTACARGGQLRNSWYFALFNLPFLPEWVAEHRAEKFDLALLKGGMTRDDVARVRRDVIEYGALSGGLGWYRALPFEPFGWAKEKVAVPTTHVWSDRDVALSRMGAEICGRWVTGPYELVVLEGVSHWIPAQAPNPLADAILARIASLG